MNQKENTPFFRDTIETLCNLSSQMSSMTTVQKKIAKYLLDDSTRALNLSITQLANELSINPSSITRFCQKLGFSGYSDFCITVKRQIISPQIDDAYYDFYGESSGELVRKSIVVFNRMINETLLLLDDKKLDLCTTLLANAHNVYAFGHGSGNASVLYAQAIFLQIGLPCLAFYEPSQVLISASLACKEDIIIIFSFSGRNKNLIEAIRLAKQNKVKIISITGFSNSPIAQMSDVSITYHAHIKDDVRFLYLARICEVTIIGIIENAIIMHNQDKIAKHLSVVKWAVNNMRDYNNASDEDSLT